jgi:tetrachlorobenzoquinone reductase
MKLSLSLVVTAYKAEALDIVSLELRDPAGEDLPAFEPGAHLAIALSRTVQGSESFIRHYSLCNDPSERHRYVIAVGRAKDGRGGSETIHTRVRVGTRLVVHAPRNTFRLLPDAPHYQFIAGGVGITPILCMIRRCISHRKNWSLLYCTRSRVRAAFYEELQGYGERVQFHFDDEASAVPDIHDLLKRVPDNAQIYCCGPFALMKTVERESSGRPAGSVHFEWFSAAPREREAKETAFEVILKSSGRRLDVMPDRSILETLEVNGVSVPFSCREGLCRTCEIGLCEGEADHRDFVLSDHERQQQKSVIVCVSRSKTTSLLLDL